MIAEDTHSSVKEELARARGALAASSLLFDGGFKGEAISRLFFALLYQVRAFLRSRGLEPESHEDALRLLSLHLEEARAVGLSAAGNAVGAGNAVATAVADSAPRVVGAATIADSAARVFSRLRTLREEADERSFSFSRDDYYRLRTETAAVAAALDTEMKAAGFSN